MTSPNTIIADLVDDRNRMSAALHRIVFEEFEENDNLQDVLIVGYDGNGELLVRSSRMDRKDALWLAELLRNWAINGE
jgi:hypothetical protein